MMSMPATALDMSDALRSRQVSSVEIVRNAFETIDTSDDTIHAFISISDRQKVLDSAKKIDAARAREEYVPPFAGVPIAVKDNIAVAGQRLTCGSLMLETYVAPFDASAIARLKAAGLLIVGKTNLDEFGFGSSTENSAFFATRNPRAPGCVPGGSSGGSAAAVASGMVPWALGTDTGGSIRQPASLCGVVGMRPTYGRVSRYGVVAFASSMDQIGPLANTASDASALLSIIMGQDELDSTSISTPNDIGPLRASNPLTVGIPEQYLGPACQPEVVAAVKRTAEVAKELGWNVRSVSLPLTEYALPIYYLISSVEAASNLARFDGVKYGYRSASARNYEDLVPKSRAEAFGDEVKRRIMLGTFAASAGYQDQYYNRACAARTAVSREFASTFEQVDLLLSPISPTTAWSLGERVGDPLRMYMSDILSVPAALAGVPALALPYGVDSQSRPVGVQLTGAYGRDAQLLAAATALESAIEAGRVG